ncbi:hypothetical protein AAC387_Pa04g2369 [Persea americana]
MLSVSCSRQIICKPLSAYQSCVPPVRIPHFQLHRSFLSSAQRLKRKMKFDNQEIPNDYHTAEAVSAIVGNALVIFSFMKQTYRLEDDKKTAIYVRVLNVLAFLLGAW